MLTIQRVRGEEGPPEVVTVVARSQHGGYEDAAGRYNDWPPLRCEVWRGGSLPVLASLPCVWDEAERGTVRIEFPAAVMADVAVGRHSLRVVTADDGVTVIRASLVVYAGPADGVERPAYHSYDDLLTECPWVADRFDAKLHDQTGFANVAAETRDWIDAQILAIARRRGASLYASYVEALAADLLVLDSPGGRMIVKASVYHTLASIFRRALGYVKDPDKVDAMREFYEAKTAESMAAADFAFVDGVPPRLDPGSMVYGRVVRR